MNLKRCCTCEVFSPCTWDVVSTLSLSAIVLTIVVICEYNNNNNNKNLCEKKNQKKMHNLGLAKELLLKTVKRKFQEFIIAYGRPYSLKI